jgi:hypothetical protein
MGNPLESQQGSGKGAFVDADGDRAIVMLIGALAALHRASGTGRKQKRPAFGAERFIAFEYPGGRPTIGTNGAVINRPNLIVANTALLGVH